jgi:hypothetical protein
VPGPHPVEVGGDLQSAEDSAQVPGHWCLQRQEHERAFFDMRAHRGDLFMIGNDLFC